LSSAFSIFPSGKSDGCGGQAHGDGEKEQDAVNALMDPLGVGYRRCRWWPADFVGDYNLVDFEGRSKEKVASKDIVAPQVGGADCVGQQLQIDWWLDEKEYVGLVHSSFSHWFTPMTVITKSRKSSRSVIGCLYRLLQGVKLAT